jgi:putative acetyltransferase
MIRWAEPVEAAETVAWLQYRAVREGPSLYSEAQRAAWVATPHPPEALSARLRAARVALFLREGLAVGVMTFSPGGYIDMAFILPKHQGTGVFRALFDAVEARACAASEQRLWTFASLMAEPAFRAVGFSVIHRETVDRAGVMLPRARMEKVLQ